MFLAPRPVLAAAFAVSAACAPLAAQSLLAQYGEIVLASGMQLPGSNGASPNDFPAGAVFATSASGGIVVQPVIDRNGTLLFRARAQDNASLGIEATNAWAFYMGRANGDLRMLVRQNDPAPGLPTNIRVNGTTLSPVPFRGFRISPIGEVVTFSVGLVDPITPANVPTTADSAMFAGTAGALQLLAREGDAVTAVGGGALYGEMDANSLGSFLLDSSGTVVFRNRMQNGIGGVTASNDAVMLIGTPGNLSVLLREGSPWPGAGSTGEVVDRAYPSSGDYPVTAMHVNEAGKILHDVHFVVPSGSATSTANDRALAIWHAGTDVIVAREGDQAPGMPAGALFADSSPTSGFANLMSTGLNRGATFVFMTTFPAGPGGVTTANDRAFFMGTAGSLSMVLREGDPAPAALGAGVLWGTASINMVLGDADQLAFSSSLGGAVTAADDSAIFTGTPGNFAAIAREGDPAPGLPGYVFAELNPPLLTITERGHVLFNQQVTNGTTKTVAYSYTPEHGLRLFYDPADAWTTALGTSTLPTSFLAMGPTNSGDTAGASLNNNGDMACWLNFQTTEPVPMGAAIVRGHVGSFTATPSSVPATGGVPQNFFVDCGPAQAGRLYVVLASALGTRPGFPSPLGPQTVPLNFDPLWTMLSINAANSPLWVNTLGFTDANGKGIGAASFVMPPGFPGFAGTTVHHAALVFDGTLTSTFVTEPSALKFF